MRESWDTEPDDDSFWRSMALSPWFGPGLILSLMVLFGSAIFVFGDNGWAVATSVPLMWIGFACRSGCLRIMCFGLASFLLLTLLLPGMGHPRVISDFIQSKNNFRQIGLALQNYHDTYRTFPPAFVADEGGRPKHSWRVLILPYLELQPVYEQYDFSEPWDSPHNREIGKQVIEVLHDPNFGRSPSAAIHYFAVIGPHAAWPGAANRCHSVRDFPKGASRTVLAIETSAVAATWSEPRDLTLEEAINALSQPDSDGPWMETSWFYDVYLGRHVLLADGAVYRFMPMSRADARSLLTIDIENRLDQKTFDDLTTFLAPTPRRYHLFKYAHKLAAFGIFLIVVFMPGLWKIVRRRRSTSNAPLG